MSRCTVLAYRDERRGTHHTHRRCPMQDCPIGVRHATQQQAENVRSYNKRTHRYRKARPQVVPCACGGFHVVTVRLETLRLRNPRYRQRRAALAAAAA